MASIKTKKNQKKTDTFFEDQLFPLLIYKEQYHFRIEESFFSISTSALNGPMFRFNKSDWSGAEGREGQLWWGGNNFPSCLESSLVPAWGRDAGDHPAVYQQLFPCNLTDLWIQNDMIMDPYVLDSNFIKLYTVWINEYPHRFIQWDQWLFHP